MFNLGRNILVIAMLVSLAFSAWPADSAKGKSQEEIYPQDLGPFIGDWKGVWLRGEAKFPDIAAQVIPLGNGEYQVNLVPKIYQRTPPFAVVTATEKAGKLVFNNGEYFGQISNGKFTGGRRDDKAAFEMERYTLVSPTLGAKPPKNAIVLFDGSGFDELQTGSKDKSWFLMGNGIMQANPDAGTLKTKREFNDIKLHLEFRTPLLPDARGQARGNSGVKIKGKYEAQILDSYGLHGYWNECGALYKISAPHVNMCAPPTHWQTYDIIFRDARFNKAGELVEYPKMTVIHNGVAVQKEHELPYRTSYRAGSLADISLPEPASINFQAHGNPVQYRNIWVVDLPAKE